MHSFYILFVLVIFKTSIQDCNFQPFDNVRVADAVIAGTAYQVNCLEHYYSIYEELNCVDIFFAEIYQSPLCVELNCRGDPGSYTRLCYMDNTDNYCFVKPSIGYETNYEKPPGETYWRCTVNNIFANRDITFSKTGCTFWARWNEEITESASCIQNPNGSYRADVLCVGTANSQFKYQDVLSREKYDKINYSCVATNILPNVTAYNIVNVPFVCKVPILAKDRPHLVVNRLGPTPEIFSNQLTITPEEGYILYDASNPDSLEWKVLTCDEDDKHFDTIFVKPKTCSTEVINSNDYVSKRFNQMLLESSPDAKCYYNYNDNKIYYEKTCTVTFPGNHRFMLGANAVDAQTTDLNCEAAGTPNIQFTINVCTIVGFDNTRVLILGGGCERTDVGLNVHGSCNIEVLHPFVFEVSPNVREKTLNCPVNDVEILLDQVNAVYPTCALADLVITFGTKVDSYVSTCDVQNPLNDDNSECFINANRGFGLEIPGDRSLKKAVRITCGTNRELNIKRVTLVELTCPMPIVENKNLFLGEAFTHDCSIINNKIKTECFFRANRGFNLKVNYGAGVTTVYETIVFCNFDGTSNIEGPVKLEQNECDLPIINTDENDPTIEEEGLRKNCIERSNNKMRGECSYSVNQGFYIRLSPLDVNFLHSLLVFCHEEDDTSHASFNLYRYECPMPGVTDVRFRPGETRENTLKTNCAEIRPGFIDQGCIIYALSGFSLSDNANRGRVDYLTVHCTGNNAVNIAQITVQRKECSFEIDGLEQLMLPTHATIAYNRNVPIVEYTDVAAFGSRLGFKVADPDVSLQINYCLRHEEENDQTTVSAILCQAPAVYYNALFPGDSAQPYYEMCARDSAQQFLAGCSFMAYPGYQFVDERNAVDSGDFWSFRCAGEAETSPPGVMLERIVCDLPVFFFNNSRVDYERFVKNDTCQRAGESREKFAGRCSLSAVAEHDFLDEDGVRSTAIRLACFLGSRIDQSYTVERRVCNVPVLGNGFYDEDCNSVREGQICHFTCYPRFAVPSNSSETVTCMFNENSEQLEFYPRALCVSDDNSEVMQILWLVFSVCFGLLFVSFVGLLLNLRKRKINKEKSHLAGPNKSGGDLFEMNEE